MSNIALPHDIAETDSMDYRSLHMAAIVFTALRSYWGYSIQKTLELFQQHNIYRYIQDNYDFFHTVGITYIVEDICANLNLPIGSWTRR